MRWRTSTSSLAPPAAARAAARAALCASRSSTVSGAAPRPATVGLGPRDGGSCEGSCEGSWASAGDRAELALALANASAAPAAFSAAAAVSARARASSSAARASAAAFSCRVGALPVAGTAVSLRRTLVAEPPRNLVAISSSSTASAPL
eukprot:jgi/Chrpa1/22419/Chrysochromulina_OHIO_Genome00013831-RA